MREITAVVSTDKYDDVVIKLKDLLNKKGVSRTKLTKATNANYSVIKRLYDGDLYKLDLYVIARVCYVLECEISDIIEYRQPE